MKDKDGRHTSVRAWRNGLTVDELQAYLDKYGHECAVCKKPYDPAKRWGGLVTDHDHACCDRHVTRRCGQCLRGLLCVACNAGLGQFGDDPERLQAAIDYLKRQPPRITSDETLQARLRRRNGVASNAAKLTPEEVREIRRRHSAGEQYRAIARDFGVGEVSISYCVKRKTYAYID